MSNGVGGVRGPGGPPSPEGPTSGSTYIVRRGDTLTKIARDHGVSLRDLLRANPHIQDPNRILPGQEIRIPERPGQPQAPASSASGTPQVIYERPQPGRAFRDIERQATDSLTRQAAVEDLARAASRVGSGLTADERARLQRCLSSLSGPALRDEVNFLRTHVMESPNADRALRTYLELKDLQGRYPQRITDDIVRTLTRGVADRRTPAPAGAEGVLGQQQAVDAARALANMPQPEYDRVVRLLDSAGRPDGRTVEGADPQVERALILKAVAARADELSHPGWWDRLRTWIGLPSQAMGEIETYARQIRGMPRDELIQRSTVLDLDGDAQAEALQQRFKDSCAPTTAQMTRAEADPIYAWRLHEEAIHSTAADTRIGEEQRRVLEAHGGRAVPRGRASQGQGMLTELALRDVASPYTNRVYNRVWVDDSPEARQAALDRIDNLLRRGIDVPISVGWNNGGGHAMIITDVRGRGDDRQYLITDPWNGETRWIRHRDIVQGNTDFIAGRGRLRATFE